MADVTVVQLVINCMHTKWTTKVYVCRICVKACFKSRIQTAEVINETAQITLTAAFHRSMRRFN